MEQNIQKSAKYKITKTSIFHILFMGALEHIGKEEFNNLYIVIDSGFSSNIVTGKMVPKLKRKKNISLTCITQVKCFTTNEQFKI